MRFKYDRLVRIDLDGRCVCPYHGAQSEAQEYAPGRALCGCLWVLAGDGVRLRVASPVAENSHLVAPGLATTCEPTAENAT